MSSNAPFYSAWVEIVPDAKNLRKTLAREFDAAGPDAGRRAGKGISSGVLGSVGKLAAPLAAAFAAVGIGGIIKDSITNASDFAESGTAISAVFGNADKTIQAFAANSAASLGQSTNMTLDAARTFGVFGKAAGLGGEELAGFSTDFITLAGDLASFNNTTPEAAIEALGAGLRGESEPLRKYGVLLDDATLKARATELGIYSGSGALTSQQKILASQAEIMAQTGVAQGDFAKTSGGLANQQRILSAGLTNLSTTFGALLLPAMTTVVGFLNRSVLPALGNIMPAIALIKGSFTGLGADVDLGGMTNPLINFGATLRTIFDAVGPLVGRVFELWTAFSPLSLLFKAIQPVLPQLLDAFAGLATVLGGALMGSLTAMMPSITEFSGLLVGLISGLITTLLPIVVELVGVMGPLLGAVIAAVLPLFDSLMGVILQVAAAVMPLITPILALIVPLAKLIGAILPPLIKLFVAILTPVIALASAIIAVLVPVLKVIITVLSAVIGWVAKALTFFVQLVTGAGNAGRDLGRFFAGIPKMIGDAFGNLVRLGVNAGRDLIGGFIDGIKNMIGKVGDAIGGVMDFVGGFFPHSPAKRGPFSGSGWRAVKNAGQAIGDQFGSGLSDSQPDFNAELGSLVSASSLTARVDASVYGSQARATDPTGTGKGITNNIFEAVSAVATAMEVTRRQNAIGAV